MVGLETEWVSQVATWIALTVIVVGLLQTLLYLLQLGLAASALAVRPPVASESVLWRRYGEVSPPITVIVPAYNEAVSIVESVRSLLGLIYPKFEVIVINDGSTDDTLQQMIDGFGLQPTDRSYDLSVPHQPIRGLYASERQPRLLLVDKENGGKADAMNAGINLSRAPIFCTIDADSLIESDALLRAIQPFVDDPERTVAVGGTVRIANGCKIVSGRVTQVGLPTNLLALFQIIEYLRAFLMARLALSRIGTLTIISGAFGIFRRQVAVEVGGYRRDTVGEDLELVVKIHRHMRQQKRPYRIEFVPEPVCWTEVPETLTVLGRQRRRWQRGALETFGAHRRMLFNPRYGRIGFLGFGQIFLVDVLGPLVEILGYLVIPISWLIGILEVQYFLAFLAVTFSLGVFISVCSLILEEVELKRFPRASHLAILAVAAIAENFGYRQINNLWRLQGCYQYLRGRRDWGRMSRLGLAR